MNGDFGSLNNADREADERLLREKSLKMADSKHNDEDPISDEELRPQAFRIELEVIRNMQEKHSLTREQAKRMRTNVHVMQTEFEL